MVKPKRDLGKGEAVLPALFISLEACLLPNHVFGKPRQALVLSCI